VNEPKSARYQRLRRRARLAGAGPGVLVLAATAWPPVARRLAALADGLAAGASDASRAFVALALFVLFVVVLWELAALPAALYVSLRLDRTYQRGSDSVEDVLAAQAQAAAIAAAVAFAAGAVVLASVRVAGAWWWTAAGAALALMLVVGLRGAPALFARLGDLRPFDRPGLGARLSALAARADVHVRGISQWMVAPASPMTAMVAGVGRSRRILVASGIARDWSDDEIAVVVAHELAHVAHRDLWWTAALDTMLLCGGLWLADAVVRAVAPSWGVAGPADLAALPVVALVGCLVWLLATPVRHAQSRRQERRADEFALALTGAADAFRAAVRRLGARHLAEDRPSRVTRWLYHRHPSVAERLRTADAYKVRGSQFAVRGSRDGSAPSTER
jgi:STE24 endopeptidase